MKKGVIFTMDVLIGLILLAIIIISIKNTRIESSLPERRFERLNIMSNDIMTVLSNLNVQDVRNYPTINNLISSDVIKEDDYNKTVLDLITSLWYSGNKSISQNISYEILGNITNDVCVAIFVENQSIFSSCEFNSEKEASVTSRIETGYEVGRPSYGYISRAFLTGIKNKITSEYVYFGGYEGDGNLTKILQMPEDFNITSLYLEGSFGNNFSLFINDTWVGLYNVSYNASANDMKSISWIICNTTFNFDKCSLIKPGNNIIKINFTDSMYNFVGGGFIRATYKTSQLSEETLNQSKYIFPGINGLINLYSSLYIPGNLNGMDIYLHLKNNYTTFFSIGNTTVWKGNATSEIKINVNNATLSGILNYNSLSNKTVPLRLGTEAFVSTIGGKADVILITDVSGSMGWQLNNSSPGIDYECDRLNESNTNRISLAKCLDKEFVSIVLNVSGNRIGLVSYSGIPNTIPTANSQIIRSTHNLSTNVTSLNNQINSYTPSGATGICGALRQARKMLQDQSNSSRNKFIVLMTDGLANVQCSPTNPNQTSGCIPRICPNQGYCPGGGCLYSTCGDWISDRATNDAIQEACNAANYSIVTYSIGFGPVALCPASNYTLSEIASCGNGKYYSSTNATELQEIYRRIAGEIVSISYETQRINITGNVSMNNILYPDSYISYNYSSNVMPLEYGEITMTRETNKIGEMINYTYNSSFVQGGFEIPNVKRIIDAKATSYSSEYWTDNVMVRTNTSSWNNFYKLSYYGNNYQLLGDPFIVQIPSNLLETGKMNYIAIGTGLSPMNSTGGSPDDKVIYKFVVSGIVGYGDVFNSSEDAVNDAKQRLYNQIGGYVDIENQNIEIEEKSIGGIQWMWGPSLLKVIVWEK